MAGLLRRVMDDGTYNGWKNYGTWNVALWVQNDERYYRDLMCYLERYKGHPTARPTWAKFCKAQGWEGRQDRTPGGIRWNSRELDHRALTAMIREHMVD